MKKKNKVLRTEETMTVVMIVKEAAMMVMTMMTMEIHSILLLMKKRRLVPTQMMENNVSDLFNFPNIQMLIYSITSKIGPRVSDLHEEIGFGLLYKLKMCTKIWPQKRRAEAVKEMVQSRN
jgi:hypothetical protein